MRFWGEGLVLWDVGGVWGVEEEREDGGPTLTIREPNSTPIVTSCCGTKRPSQRRIVSCFGGFG